MGSDNMAKTPQKQRGFGEVIAELRTARGWSAYKLARMADVHFSPLYLMEKHGDAEPKLTTVRKLAHALDVTLDDICNMMGPLDIRNAPDERKHCGARRAKRPPCDPL